MILFSTEKFSFWKQIVSASSFMQFIIISLNVVSTARWFFENAFKSPYFHKVREPPLQEKSVFYLCNLRSIIRKLIRIVTVYYMFVYPLCFSNQCKKRLTVVFYKHSLQCIPYFRRRTNKSEDRKLHLIFEKVH